MTRDAGTKKGKGAENFKKAHSNYFELKPGCIDAQWATTGHSGVFRILGGGGGGAFYSGN